MKKLALLLVFGLMGCATMMGANSMPDEGDRKELVKQYPDLTADQQAKFIKGEPWIGMNQPQLETLMGGSAKKSQRKIAAAGSQDIQLYAERVGNWKTGVVTKYFRAIMTEGKLSEFQELNGDVGSFDKL